MPGSEMLEFTELGINLHQPLTPMDRNHSPLTNYQNLKTSEMVYVFRQSVEPGLLEQMERVQPLFPPFLCVQHSYGNLSTTGSPEFQLTGWGVLLLGCFFFCLGGSMCGVWCFCQFVFKGRTDVLWVCLHLPLLFSDTFVMVTGQMSRCSSGAPFPIFP